MGASKTMKAPTSPNTPASLARLIETYGLAPHPEGGFFRESYRAAETIPQSALPSRFAGERRHCTAIYFLLPEGSKSNLHRIKSDEVWHFYLGGPLTLAQIHPGGRTKMVTLGQDISRGEKLQHVVPMGCWFGAYPNPSSGFSFVGCTVAPGFDFADFELGQRSRLIRKFPGAKALIERLTDS